MKLANFISAFLITNLALGAYAATPVNAPIDLTAPNSAQPQTDAEVFDESASFAPNFAINQNTSALSDLFGSTGSQLCFPTALAENLAYLQAYHSPKFSSLQLAGLSNDEKTLDTNALVRSLASSCKTSKETGTNGSDALNCVLDLLKQSGYGIGRTQFISPFITNPSPSFVPREVRIQDIRNSLKNGSPIILEVGWFRFDVATKTWVRHGGHFVSAYGYDYNRSWGENQIQLKIINPEIDYGTSRQDALWNTVIIERVAAQPGISYPAHRPFIISGTGFSGFQDRAFVGELLTISPQ